MATLDNFVSNAFIQVVPGFKLMQALSRSFKRLYSTADSSKLPNLALAARTASTPLAVRLRRQKKIGKALGPEETDARPSGLTPSDYASYLADRARGKFIIEYGRDLTEDEFQYLEDTRRSRLRGIELKEDPETGEVTTKVVGHRIYLPNMIFRMVRNHTPEGQPYNPYEATFRIPLSITKHDIRWYLHSVYGVRTTYVRTDNYLAPLSRGMTGMEPGPHYKTYKRAVVGLVDPFYYPQRIEDMPEEEAEKRKEWIEENFNIQATEKLRKMELLRMTRKGSTKWRWRGQPSASRKAILSRVVARRYERDVLLSMKKEELQLARVSQNTTQTS